MVLNMSHRIVNFLNEKQEDNSHTSDFLQTIKSHMTACQCFEFTIKRLLSCFSLMFPHTMLFIEEEISSSDAPLIPVASSGLLQTSKMIKKCALLGCVLHL